MQKMERKYIQLNDKKWLALTNHRVCYQYYLKVYIIFVLNAKPNLNASNTKYLS